MKKDDKELKRKFMESGVSLSMLKKQIKVLHREDNQKSQLYYKVYKSLGGKMQYVEIIGFKTTKIHL